MSLEYTECEKTFHTVPRWVNSLIQYGYYWGLSSPDQKRRIGVVTTPCESTSAGLIALGLLRRGLENDSANDRDFHFDLLLKACRHSLAKRSHGDKKTDFVFDHKGKKWLFSDEQTSSEMISVYDASYKETIKRKNKVIPNPNGPCFSTIHRGNSSQWRLESQHVVETCDATRSLSMSVYQDIFPYFENEIIEDNLATSYSGTLMVGGGLSAKSDYMKKLRSVGFRLNGITHSLPELLTIEQAKNSVSRMRFDTTQRLEKVSCESSTVIADGSKAFMSSISRFRDSDVIGVISRDEPTQNIEDISELLASMKRYYISGAPDFIIPGNSFSVMLMRAR